MYTYIYHGAGVAVPDVDVSRNLELLQYRIRPIPLLTLWISEGWTLALS